ncbi:AAA family ATPase [Novosphingobium bradum]|uniref:AAA family ATPase n=1 Tax=Novosphingobium bradum TaxID=1737444 RepID=A0ABV7IRG3_9SPHN
MHIRRLTLDNVRSFKDRTDFHSEGDISILIGPNGSGKTNLLDAAVIMLRKHLFASMHAVHTPSPEQVERYEFRHNDALNQLILEKHSARPNDPQVIEIEVETSESDIKAMTSLKTDAYKLMDMAKYRYANLQYQLTEDWDLSALKAGQRFVYTLRDNALVYPQQDKDAAIHFHQFLKIYETDSQLRDEFELSSLSTPMIYLPINRSANPLTSSIELAGYNAYEQKRHSDIATSRTQFSLVQVAIGRMAQRHRKLLGKDKGDAASVFKSEPNLVKLTKALKNLGYEWDLICTNDNKNAYDIQLSKQGSKFYIGRASSGERELLTYLFTIYALNVRDAFILIDEPELHLHPRWQSILLALFENLANETGNQFLFATHSPTFVSPSSINYVSRVYSEDQSSHIVRLDTSSLPNGKHLLSIVNSHNNERIFFADLVILVEGLSDRVFFEAIFKHLIPNPSVVYEVVSVGGKGLFPAYESVLHASAVPFVTIADLDYIEQVGTDSLRGLLKTNTKKIKEKVIEDGGSVDGDSLVNAIESAMTTGHWGQASSIWEYIKAQRRSLPKALRDEQKAELSQFLNGQKQKGIYILSKGSLESYLSPDLRSKDMQKLIEFLTAPDFWDRLPSEAFGELSEIAYSIFGPPDGPETGSQKNHTESDVAIMSEPV